ncbi:MAG TPA: GerMN domain-containing protein [Candidatus Acidoferrum sp.]
MTEFTTEPARVRWKFWLTTLLVFAVIGAAIFVPILRRRMKRAARLQQQSEEQARRELIQQVPMNPSDPRAKAKLFWLSDADNSVLAPVVVELPLSSDPVLRSKQVLNTLLAGPVDAELRTLPPDAVLLAFYVLPDGTAIADFSEALATSIPSGIASEQLAVDSLARTLQANVPQVKRLKILIHGQEVETLAGHVDLTGTFDVNAGAAQTPANPATPPAAGKAGSLVAPALTPDGIAVKLAQP